MDKFICDTDIKKAGFINDINFISDEIKNINQKKIKFLNNNVERAKAIIDLGVLTEIDKGEFIEAGIFEFALVYCSSKNIKKSLSPAIYNDKLRDIIDNIKNGNIKKLINKKVNLQEIAFMTPQELAPNKWKELLRKQELRAYKRNNMAATDLYQCRKCGERKCQITQMQTRSADEPMTNFITCLVCGTTFKK